MQVVAGLQVPGELVQPVVVISSVCRQLERARGVGDAAHGKPGGAIGPGDRGAGDDGEIAVSARHFAEGISGARLAGREGVDSGWVQNSTLGSEDALAVVSQIAVRVDVAIESNGPHA